mgnify:CR=1 FL=1
MTPVDLRTAPAFEASARLQWRLTISLEPSWDGSDVVDPATAPLWMNLGALPEGLPFISTQDWCRCLDPLALVRSTQHPGEYYVLNSACGVPDDADLWRPMHVNFPDDQHIVWEMDRHRNHDVLQAPYEGDSGFVRWTFERQAYEECAHDILDGLLQFRRRIHERTAQRVSRLAGTHATPHHPHSRIELRKADRVVGVQAHPEGRLAG